MYRENSCNEIVKRVILFMTFCSMSLANNPVQTSVPTKLNALKCNIDMMRSYLLKGRRTASEEQKMYLCPTIKDNCCTKADQQRAYHIVNDILPPRLDQYEESVKLALAKIRRFHFYVIKNPPVFVGNARRRAFCMRQARIIYGFPFDQLYLQILGTLDEVNIEMREYYRKFFCVICDGKNHSYMEFERKNKRVMFDGSFCKNVLENKGNMINMLNVQLVSYLVSLQNLVDCKHYVKSFNLDFFSSKKVKSTVELINCIDFLQSKDFLKHCKLTCAELNLSKVVSLIQGDYEFFMDAVNLFQKFFDFQETGNFISTKLRTFFKNHVINVQNNQLPDRKLNKNKQKNKGAFKIKNRHVLNKFKQISSDQMKRMKLIFKTGKKEEENKAFMSKLKPIRNLMDLKMLADDGVPENKVQKINGKKPDVEKTNNKIKKKSSLKIMKVRNSKKTERILHGENKTDPIAKGVKSAKLVFDKNSLETYNLIHLSLKREKIEHVYKVQPPPIDFDRAHKIFRNGVGINPEFYWGLKYGLDQHVLYRILYGEKKTEKANIPLEFFLSDFTDDKVMENKSDMSTDFKIDVLNYEQRSGFEESNKKE